MGARPAASPAARELLRLRLAEGMNRERFRRLVARFGGFESVRLAGPAAVAQVLRCPDDAAISIARGANPEAVDREVAAIEALGAFIATPDDPDYPAALRQCSSTPPLLYCLGNLLPADRAAVAIIGSRKATSYGMAAARDIAANLARAGVTIVSGLALGVDSAAHRGAIDAHGRTIAALGFGLDQCYPSQNRALFQQIARHGCLVSEYPLGTKPQAHNFPERNQIIATLSLATVVMEAAEKSGTLITSRLCLEENRLLFALPGDVTRASSRGTNRLIRDGAILAQDANDILRDLAPQLQAILQGWKLHNYVPEEETHDGRPADKALQNQRTPTQPASKTAPSKDPSIAPETEATQATQTGQRTQASPGTQTGQHTQASQFTQASKAAQPAQAELPGLDSEEEAPWNGNWAPPSTPSPQPPRTPLPPEAQAILQILLEQPIQYDDLLARAAQHAIPAHKVAGTLLKLELHGLCKQLPGRIYAAL